MSEFRKIAALPRTGVGNEPGPAPEILFLEPRQLVVNDEYQRDLSKGSIKQIRSMAADWDWCSFKAPNVARTEDPNVYEVVDGQHTAIAAATNGNIPFLPCLVMTAETLAQKAKGFLGINKNRLTLTRAAIYGAQVAAQDDTAIAVEAALSRSGGRVLAMPPNQGKYSVGDTMAISALLDIAKKRGEDRLALIMGIAIEAHAAPVSSALLKALDIALPLPTSPEVANRMTVVLRSQGAGRLEMIAKSRAPQNAKVYEVLADTLAVMAKIERRLGRPRGAPGRKAAA